MVYVAVAHLDLVAGLRVHGVHDDVSVNYAVLVVVMYHDSALGPGEHRLSPLVGRVGALPGEDLAVRVWRHDEVVVDPLAVLAESHAHRLHPCGPAVLVRDDEAGGCADA